MMITSETPVRDIAIGIPNAIPVLEKLGLDYCCGGKHTLAEACASHSIAIADALKNLERLQQQDEKPVENQWANASLKDLSEHIVKKHHAYTRKQLDLIDELMAKVESRHGKEHVEVFQLGKVVAVFGSELRHHTECEEAHLFPYIASLGTGQELQLPAAANGSLELPITRMMTNHDQAGKELQTIRELTNDYTPPPTACPTWRAL